MKKPSFIILILLLTIFFNHSIHAQIFRTGMEWKKDQLFPGKGNSTFQIGTGIPYVAYGEFSYGFSNRFAAGILFAKNPYPGLHAFGVRLRGVLYQTNEKFRVYGELPMVVYPKTITSGIEPWYIVLPSIMVEKKYKSGLRLAFGASLIAGGCVDALLGEEEEDHETDDETSIFNDQGGFMGGLWYSINSSVSFPVANRLMFEGKLSYIAGTIEIGDIVSKRWFNDIPAVLIIGVSYTF